MALIPVSAGIQQCWLQHRLIQIAQEFIPLFLLQRRFASRDLLKEDIMAFFFDLAYCAGMGRNTISSICMQAQPCDCINN